MAAFIASALAGISAEDQQEAEEIAEHSADLEWEVVAVAPAWAPEPAMTPSVEVAAHKLLGQCRRPIFGKFSVVALPAMAYAYVSDTSAIGLVVSAFSAVVGF